MRRVVALLGVALPLIAGDFSGARAFEHTRKAVELGPRPPGSAAIHKLQDYIHAQLKTCRCEVRDDDFTATTPQGPVAMKNIIARFKGTSGQAVVVSGHYDTKVMPGFVGANDGGSSTGILLELARSLTGMTLKYDVLVVFFDGEEAYVEWGPTDGTYGSRHLAEKWAAEGKLAGIRALINVDMTGDRDLDILPEQNSDAGLRALAWKVAGDLGFGKHFLASGGPVEDDHMPFVARGVKCLDLIDFDYAPWHTTGDTLDQVGAESMAVTGQVVMEMLKRI